jgi:hypothetical protein
MRLNGKIRHRPPRRLHKRILNQLRRPLFRLARILRQTDDAAAVLVEGSEPFSLFLFITRGETKDDCEQRKLKAES